MKDHFLSTLRTSRDYTLAVAEAMPESSYQFKPDAAAGWNFLELMHHIAYGISWWEENYVKGNPIPWQQPNTTKGKKHAIDALTRAYQSLETTVHQLQVIDKALKGFHATIDHITHHRAQAVVYLRCKNIHPPEYVY